MIAIPHCKELTDEVVETICENCKQLIELHIPNSSITDYSLKVIGDKLHYLSIVNLLGTQVTMIFNKISIFTTTILNTIFPGFRCRY